MKTNFLKVVMLAIFSIATLTGFSQDNTSVNSETGSVIKTVSFKSNLNCNACVNKVKENIAYEKGVKDLDVNLEKNTITIKYKANKTSEETLASAIKELGYDAKKECIVKSDCIPKAGCCGKK